MLIKHCRAQCNAENVAVRGCAGDDDDTAGGAAAAAATTTTSPVEVVGTGDSAIDLIDHFDTLLAHNAALLTVAGVECVGDPARAANASLNIRSRTSGRSRPGSARCGPARTSPPRSCESTP